MSDFKTGDAVWQKSPDSPKMIIININNDQITCEWFNSKKELQRKTFNKNSLTKTDPREDLATGFSI